MHDRAPIGHGIPLILTHGWPSSFAEYLPLVPLLTDPAAHRIDGPGFDVVIPSLPGYGFSDRPARTGINTPRHRRAVASADAGTRLSALRRWTVATSARAWPTFMALDDPDPMIGIHLTQPRDPALPAPGSRPLSDAERAYLGAERRWGESSAATAPSSRRGRRRSATD